MDSKTFVAKLLPLLGGEENLVRQNQKEGCFYFTVKDSGAVRLEELCQTDGVAAAQLNRGRVRVTAKENYVEDIMMAKNYNALADALLELVGGKDNISFFTHCITRLRLNLKDKNRVKSEQIQGLPGIIGIHWAGDQFQIIVGQNVGEVYDLMCEKGGLKKQEAIQENLDKNISPKKFSINTLFETLSACIVPVIPAMCGAGIIKGILILLTTYKLISTETGMYIVLNAASDAPFYFLPFMVAYGASKKFNTSTILSMTIAGIYVHPTITALSGSALNLFGINISMVKYSTTVFPILISIWVMSYLYRWINKRIPSTLRIVFTPALTLLIMAFLSLGLIGPLGYNIGYYVGHGIQNIFNLSPILGGLILGAIRPLVILTGMQSVFTPIITNNIAVLGYDFISPVHTVATMAVAGVCLGAFLRSDKKEDRESYLSFFVSGFIGITEPALYGLVFRFKNQLIALMVSGGVSGAVVSLLGAKKYAAGMPSWITFPAYGETIPQLFVGLAVAFVLGAALAYVLGFNGEKKQ